MSYDFKDKTVVVTGGLGALGKAVAGRFAQDGARVVIADRMAPREGTANPAFSYQTIDVLDEVRVREFFNGLGPVDVLANTIGGYAAGDPVSALDVQVFDNQIDLNLKSAFLLTKYALQKFGDRGGKIVHVASRAAVDKGANSLAYSVSKLGVLRLVEAVAAETAGQPVNINCVMPSIIDTPANRAAMPDAPHHSWPRPEQIAGIIAFLASSEAELINGAAIPVYGRA